MAFEPARTSPKRGEDHGDLDFCGIRGRVVREIRMLRAMRRVLETESRSTLCGHEGGTPDTAKGWTYGPPRQRSTLPESPEPGPRAFDQSGQLTQMSASPLVFCSRFVVLTWTKYRQPSSVRLGPPQLPSHTGSGVPHSLPVQGAR